MGAYVGLSFEWVHHPSIEIVVWPSSMNYSSWICHDFRSPLSKGHWDWRLQIPINGDSYGLPIPSEDWLHMRIPCYPHRSASRETAGRLNSHGATNIGQVTTRCWSYTLTWYAYCYTILTVSSSFSCDFIGKILSRKRYWNQVPYSGVTSISLKMIIEDEDVRTPKFFTFLHHTYWRRAEARGTELSFWNLRLFLWQADGRTNWRCSGPSIVF